MGKLLWLFGKPRPFRRMTIEINKTGSDALDSMMKKTGANGSTVYHNALVVYEALYSAQERGERIVVGSKKLTLL